ncbi:MAG: phosphoribosylformylglycinamidine synthase subunit PurS [Calditrichaeota bacterium]|nr:phosphoribosylformylglycinamidine synthase subunit PurS [Calditrichota bacterium]MCB9368255.1 phosphoribosylformylglycinamidine synthase subunit PurS [Calditrichota bacterium]
MKAKVIVKLKDTVLDPQGQAIQQLLEQRGYKNIADVRVGKFIEFDLDGMKPEDGEKMLAEIADRVLANPIIESFQIEAQ